MEKSNECNAHKIETHIAPYGPDNKLEILIPEETYESGFCPRDGEPDLDSNQVVFQTKDKIYLYQAYYCDGPNHDMFLDICDDEEKRQVSKNVWLYSKLIEKIEWPTYDYYIQSSDGNFTLRDFGTAVQLLYELEGDETTREDRNISIYGFILERNGENWTMIDSSKYCGDWILQDEDWLESV